MNIQVLADAAAAGRAAASRIAQEARAAAAARNRFLMAVSGGRTPWLMLRALAEENVPWEKVHIFQVDERVAPAGHPERNLIHIRESLLDFAPVRPKQIHGMPVEAADLEAAAGEYSRTLRQIAGGPGTLDLVHLGLGADGHTASLLPGDPALEIRDRDVGLTGPYQGWRRMTLTYPILNRARLILWLVSGREKAEMLARLMRGDVSIPAGRVRRDGADVFADRAAAEWIEHGSLSSERT